ncbi:MAG: hypothetical protein KIT18_16715, partial [Burkholderiales bacterium]|nr:hypothetical protein [Burkholderiales bacterium]
TLTVEQLTGLRVLLPTNHQTDFVLTVTASSIDGTAVPAFTTAELRVRVPMLLPPMMHTGERVDPHTFGIQPPSIIQTMLPDLHVQLAVRGSSQTIQNAGSQIIGLGSALGEEIQSETFGGIAQGMVDVEHVSRDGVAYSMRLVGENQSRASMAGNSLLLGAESLFNDLAPFSEFNGSTGGDDASGAGGGDGAAQTTTDAGTAGEPVAFQAAATGTDVNEGGESIILRVPGSTALADLGTMPFSEKLAQVAAGRALVREGLADAPNLRPVKAVFHISPRV